MYSLSIVGFLIAGCSTVHLYPDNSKITLEEKHAVRLSETVDIINDQKHEFYEEYTNNWMFKRYHYVISSSSIVSQFRTALIREIEKQGGHVEQGATRQIKIRLNYMDLEPPTQVMDVVVSVTLGFQLGQQKPFELECEDLETSFFRRTENVYNSTFSGCLKKTLNKLFERPDFRIFMGMQN